MKNIIAITVFLLVSITDVFLYAGVGGAIEVQEKVSLKLLLEHSLLFLGGFALVFGIVLALAAKKWFVKSDSRVDKVMEVLAHAHCGACGYAGCEQYADAVLNDPSVPPNLCTPAGDQATLVIAQLTGKEPKELEPHVARIMCGGGLKETKKIFDYKGVKDCRAVILAVGGDKSCLYGCLGYGTCATVCPFGAISMNDNGLPVVDESKCTGCRKCEMACPKHVIEVTRRSAKVYIACHSHDKPAVTRKKCTVGCIACGLCIKACPSNAITMTNNCVHIDTHLCTSCGACVEKCPTKAIASLIEKKS